MAEDVEEQEDPSPKKSKMPLIIGLVLALAAGGGGFFATWSGMILAPPVEEASSEPKAQDPGLVPDVAYVPIDPVVVSLGPVSDSKHLRFGAQLEVPSSYASDVQLLLPRIVDVINTYLRAVKSTDMEAPAALARIRGHLLRRIQVVTGQGRVNDLLIMEFVIN